MSPIDIALLAMVGVLLACLVTVFVYQGSRIDRLSEHISDFRADNAGQFERLNGRFDRLEQAFLRHAETPVREAHPR